MRRVKALPGLDVAVAGRRVRRQHAQGDEVAALRGPSRLAQALDEGGLIGDEVVRGQHERDLVALAAGEDRGESGGDGGRACERLAEHVVLGAAAGSCRWVGRTWAWLVMT